MARGVDVSGLSPAERAVAAGGIALFVDGFIPWWYRIETAQRTYLHNAGLTGWGLIAVFAGLIVCSFALTGAVRRRSRVRGDFIVYVVLGVGALASLAKQARYPASEWIGYWIAIAASILIVASGVRRGLERRRGWT